MPTTRRAVLGAALAPAVWAGRKAESRPNVVVFMTDDHGAWATGAYGAKGIHTPHIDALARGGMRFTEAFAATPVCSPSRMTYMTGSMPSTHSVQDWLQPVDAFGPGSREYLAGFTTWSDALAAAGYRLGMTGKWHMGHDDRAQHGFSEWATVPGGGGTYLNAEFVHNGEKKRVGRFKTDAVGDFAVNFLNQQRRGQPFGLFVPFYAPHTPYDIVPPEYSAPYRDSTFPDYPDTPRRATQNPAYYGHFHSRTSRMGYSSLITAADANIGRIVARLEELGLRDDTLIVMTADQGWNAGQHGVWGKGNGTLPFNMLEGSLRVPMIWNHAGRIRAGSSCGEMVSSYDFLPTLVEYLGVAIAADPRRVGQSYAGLLRGGAASARRTRLLFEYAYVRALRTRNLKYVERAEGHGGELYDLEADPGETRNLWNDEAYRKQRAEFRKELAESFRAMGAPPIEEWKSTVRQRMPEYKWPQQR